MTVLEPQPSQAPEKHLDLREPFVYDGEIINPEELFQRYADSPYGLHHSKQPARYSQSYGYSLDRSIIKDLGDDVHPVLHMKYTHDEITVPFLEEQRNHANNGVPSFSLDEEAELRTAAFLHDIGECTHPNIEAEIGFTVGDLEYGTFLDGDKDKELAVRRFMFTEHFPDVPERLLARVDEIDSRKSDDFVVRAFEVIERIGYFIAARRAAHILMSEHRSFDQDHSHQALLRTAQLGRLAIFVTKGHQPFLESQQNEFPYIRKVIEQHA